MAKNNKLAFIQTLFQKEQSNRLGTRRQDNLSIKNRPMRYKQEYIDAIFEAIKIYDREKYDDIKYNSEKVNIGFGFIDITGRMVDNGSVLVYSGNNSMCITPIINSIIEPKNIEKLNRIYIFISMYNLVYITIHAHKIPPHFTSKYDRIIALHSSKRNIGFYKRVRTLLPFPYSTDCNDYSSSLEYKSQKECFFKYISEKEFKFCGFNYYWNKRYSNIREEKFQFIKYQNKCHFNINKIWLKNKCKIDCEINEYYLKELYYMEAQQNTHGVIIEMHVRPSYHIHTTYLPKINMVQYLSTLGGLLSMWLGFNMWQFALKLLDKLKNVDFHRNMKYLPYRKFITNKNLTIINKSLIISATIYHIHHLLDIYLFSNKQIIIQNSNQVYFPKMFILYNPYVGNNYWKYFEYYPEFERKLNELDGTLDQNQQMFAYFSYYYALSMMKDNLKLYLKLQEFDRPFIYCRIELKDSTIACPKMVLNFNLVYLHHLKIQKIQPIVHLFPQKYNLFSSNSSDRIRKIIIHLGYHGETHGEIIILFTRSNIKYLPNFEFRQSLSLLKTNYFIYESNSVNRLEDFDHKPCIETNIGIFNNDSMDECLMDCVNQIYFQTYGCIPYLNIDNTWIRLDRNLNYDFSKIFCKDRLNLNRNLESKPLYENCMQQCPSSCNIPFFKVNHYAKDNPEEETVLNIIPKYINQFSYTESHRMSLNDLMYELGGIIGLWLGLSVMSISDLTIIIKYRPKLYNSIEQFFIKISGILPNRKPPILPLHSQHKFSLHRKDQGTLPKNMIPKRLTRKLSINVTKKRILRVPHNLSLATSSKSITNKEDILQLRVEQPISPRSSFNISSNLRPRLRNTVPMRGQKFTKRDRKRIIRVVSKIEDGTCTK